jgi:hypothetical protein
VVAKEKEPNAFHLKTDAVLGNLFLHLFAKKARKKHTESKDPTSNRILKSQKSQYLQGISDIKGF